MNDPDYSTTLSPPPGRSDRLVAVLREFMIFHEFEITPLPEGGFSARKRLRKRKKHESLIGMISELRVTPMGRDLVVDAAFGGIRAIRYTLMAVFIIMGIIMFTAMSFDPKVAGTPQRFIPLLIFIPLTIFAPLMTATLKRRTLAALERMFRAAINIVELP